MDSHQARKSEHMGLDSLEPSCHFKKEARNFSFNGKPPGFLVVVKLFSPKEIEVP